MFDISALEAYVKGNAKQIATKAITEAPTAKLFLDNGSVQPGIKGSAAVLKMDADVNFQDGSACGRTASGNTTFSDKILTVKPIKDVQNFCYKSLYNSRLVEVISKGQDPESEQGDAEFIQKTMDLRAKKIAYENEKLLWKGDTTLTGANNLKYINGILTQVEAAGSGSNAITVTGADIIAKLQSFASQVDVTVAAQEDFRIFIGQDDYNALVLAKYNAKYFNPGSEDVVPGTSFKLQIASGLNGTHKAVAGRISAFQMGLDGADDSDKAVLRYSVETEQFYVDFHFAIGVVVVFPEQTYHGSIA